MKRVIITACASASGNIRTAGLADLVLAFDFDLAWGRLTPPVDYEILFARRSTKHVKRSDHWLGCMLSPPFRSKQNESDGLALLEVLERYETIDLWMDPDPDAQLLLIGLLDYLRPYSNIVSKLKLRQADVIIGEHTPRELATWRLPTVKITREHLELASAAWKAFCAPMPRGWFDLMSKNPVVLPKLRRSMQELLEELPMVKTGLGATEMRILELISKGDTKPFDVFPGWKHANKRRVFNYWEIGALLDRLADCPAPAVSGLDEGPFTLEMHEDKDRHDRYMRSKLSLTDLGQAVLAQTEDFSRYNPIDRWWGGTHLTNDNLWRWDPGTKALIAP